MQKEKKLRMQQPQESWKNEQERAEKRVEKLKRGAKNRGIETPLRKAMQFGWQVRWPEAANQREQNVCFWGSHLLCSLVDVLLCCFIKYNHDILLLK